MTKKKLYLSIGAMLAIVLVAVLCIVLLPGDDGRVKVSYTLYDDATFEQGGILYGISDKGVIALELIDKEAAIVTLGGWDGGECENATETAKRMLAGDREGYRGRVYAVAKKFIRNNKTIEILKTAGEITYFEDGCIKNAPGLLRIFLGHNIPRSIGEGRSCNEAAFKVHEKTRFIVSKIDNLLGYVTSLDAFDGRLVYEKDVYYTAKLSVSTEIPYDPIIGEYYVTASGRFNIDAKVLGVRTVSLSDSFPERDSRDEELSIVSSKQVFAAGDVVTYDKEKDTAKVTCGGDGALVYRLLLSNSTKFSGNGTFDRTSLGTTNVKLDGDVRGTASVVSYLTYGE